MPRTSLRTRWRRGERLGKIRHGTGEVIEGVGEVIAPWQRLVGLGSPQHHRVGGDPCVAPLLVKIFGVGSGSRWNHILDRVVQQSELYVVRENSSIAGSDHLSFHLAKIPALQFSTGFGLRTHLHMPSDTPDLINAPGAVRILDLVADVLHDLLTTPEAAGDFHLVSEE